MKLIAERRAGHATVASALPDDVKRHGQCNPIPPIAMRAESKARIRDDCISALRLRPFRHSRRVQVTDARWSAAATAIEIEGNPSAAALIK